MKFYSCGMLWMLFHLLPYSLVYIYVPTIIEFLGNKFSIHFHALKLFFVGCKTGRCLLVCEMNTKGFCFICYSNCLVLQYIHNKLAMRVEYELWNLSWCSFCFCKSENYQVLFDINEMLACLIEWNYIAKEYLMTLVRYCVYDER